MRKEDIISKGKYSYPQPEQLISVKEYLFVRNEEGKKMLLLRFANKRAETCTSFGFILYRLDARGRILGEERFESSDGRKYKANATFGFDRKVEVEEKCVEFKIKLLYATYGEYAYKVENGDTVVDFKEKQVAPIIPNSTVSTGDGKIKPRKITHRALETPGMFAIITLVILAIAFLITGFQLRKFMDEEKEFTLAGLKYEFVDEDEKEPGDDVIIVGATEKYENVLIPAEIEGYNVVGVKDGAFRGDSTLKNVKIEGVNIGTEVFKDCESLESVELIGVTELGDSAFYGCKALKEIKANSLEKIGSEAFYGCRSLKTVNFSARKESTVLSLGERVFSGCTNLESVTISQFIEYPESIAIFDGAVGIKTLSLKNFAYTLPPSIEDSEDNTEDEGVGGIGGILPFSIEEAATIKSLFGDVNSEDICLERLTIGYIDSLTPEFCKDLSKLKTVIITNSDITVIPEKAFYGCKSLEEIDLSLVTAIGDSAFYECVSLRETKITKESPLTSIGKEAFYDCYSLTSVVVPSKVTMIGDKAFAKCAIEVFEFPSNLKLYGKEILAGCNNVKEVTLPSLSSEALEYLFGPSKPSGMGGIISSIPTSLKKVIVLNCTEVPDSAFKNCASLETVVLPETVEKIGASAFEGCSALKTINLTSNLKSVGSRAFKGAGIETIELTGVTSIGNGAFASCDSLKEITVPFIGGSLDDTTTQYFSYIFGSSYSMSLNAVPSSLTRVKITGEVYEAGDYAFYGCSSIKNIEFTTKLTKIGTSAFAFCSSLEAIDISEASSIGIKAFEGTSIKEAVFSNDITIIPAGVFKDNKELKSVTLGSGVTEIGESAFYGCIALTEISSPELLTKIGATAFYQAGNLKAFDLSGVTSVGTRAFAYTSIKEAILPDNAVASEAVFEGCSELQVISAPMNGLTSYLGYLFGTSNSGIPSSLKTVTIVGSGSLPYGALTDCDSVEELYVVGFGSISGYAISSCDNLRFVQLGDSISSVSTTAFEGSYKLYEINNLSSASITPGYGAGSTVIYTSSTRAPFVDVNGTRFSLFGSDWYVTSLPREDIVSVPATFSYEGSTVNSFKIPKNLLREESVIKEITFPAGVTEIGNYAFYNAHSLTAVYLDKSSTAPRIPEYAFYACGNLESVALPDASTVIEKRAFQDCTSLKMVSLPRNLQAIGEEAFYNCSSLPNIALGYDLTSIGSQAFYGCVRLYDVYNVSPLSIIAGSTSNGYVGRYALKIHTDLSEQPSDEVSVIGIGTFRNKGNEWLLISYTGTDSVLDLTGIEINGKKVISYRIAEGVFRNNTTLEKIIVDSSLKQIQSDAFCGCTNLKTVDLRRASLDVIEERTFQSCTALRYVYLPSTVKEIKSYAFDSCSYLEEIAMPSSLTTIGDGAFYNCSRLISIELPSKVQSIGSNAFYGCSSLYEVINKSLFVAPLMGSTSYGRVAYYAKGIFSSSSNAFERLNTNGCKLICIQDTWYLYAVDEGLDVELLDIPTVNGNIIIKNYAFLGASIDNILLPANTKQVELNAFSNIRFSISNVYYEGSLDELYSMTGYYNISGSIYAYAECVHDSSTWTYKDGEISTEECNVTFKTEKEATCFEDGYEIGVCDCKCGYEVSNTLYKKSHSFVNGVCTYCGLTRLSIDGDSIDELLENGTVTLNGFEYNEEKGRFESTIQGQSNSNATFMIVADIKTEISLICGTSSEYNFDILTILHNGIEKRAISGTNSIETTISLDEGDTLIFKYSKDYSGDSGEDLAYLKDMTILVKTEQK